MRARDGARRSRFCLEAGEEAVAREKVEGSPLLVGGRSRGRCRRRAHRGRRSPCARGCGSPQATRTSCCVSFRLTAELRKYGGSRAGARRGSSVAFVQVAQVSVSVGRLADDGPELRRGTAERALLHVHREDPGASARPREPLPSECPPRRRRLRSDGAAAARFAGAVCWPRNGPPPTGRAREAARRVAPGRAARATGRRYIDLDALDLESRRELQHLLRDLEHEKLAAVSRARLTPWRTP